MLKNSIILQDVAWLWVTYMCVASEEHKQQITIAWDKKSPGWDGLLLVSDDVKISSSDGTDPHQELNVGSDKIPVTNQLEELGISFTHKPM
jgi:hypothetical protein